MKGCGAPATGRFISIPFLSRISTLRDPWSAGRVNSEEMFAREDVRAIVCARGGYGANYLLEALRFGEDQGSSEDFCRLQRPHRAAHLFCRCRRLGDLPRTDGGEGLGA